MKIPVKGIPSSGLRLVQKAKPEELNLADKDINITSPINVEADVNRVSDKILVSADVEFHYQLPCARCLEIVEEASELHVDLDYTMESGQNELEIGEDIRQEIVLAFPRFPLCQENCKGICLGCGVNLNHEECRCLKSST